MLELFGAVEAPEVHVRVASATLIKEWSQHAEINWTTSRTSLLQHLIPLLGDAEEPVTQAGVKALTAVTESLPKPALCGLIPLYRMEIRSLALACGDDGK